MQIDNLRYEVKSNCLFILSNFLIVTVKMEFCNLKSDERQATEIGSRSQFVLCAEGTK
jgi:hypothetical protein